MILSATTSMHDNTRQSEEQQAEDDEGKILPRNHGDGEYAAGLLDGSRSNHSEHRWGDSDCR